MSAPSARSGPHGIEVTLPGRARALFTTRAAGNLSLAAGDGHRHGRQARDRLCDALGLRWLCAGPQVHGAEVRRVREQTGSGGAPVGEPADGHVTALSSLGMMVLAADCVPVVLATADAAGAVHAGWRGLAAGVLEEGVNGLRELAGDGEIVAAIGPCARGCCYEVGAEVLHALGLDGSRRTLDLGALARERLRDAGVAEVLDLERCTICDEDFFSHRREGVAAGRQAAIAWLS